MSLRSEFRVVKPSTISEKKRWSVRLCLQLFVGGLLSYLSYLHLIVNEKLATFGTKDTGRRQTSNLESTTQKTKTMSTMDFTKNHG
jgi:hypothetical protein